MPNYFEETRDAIRGKVEDLVQGQRDDGSLGRRAAKFVTDHVLVAVEDALREEMEDDAPDYSAAESRAHPVLIGAFNDADATAFLRELSESFQGYSDPIAEALDRLAHHLED